MTILAFFGNNSSFLDYQADISKVKKNYFKMEKILEILAVGSNWEIGQSDSFTGLPWKSIPEDFKHFQEETKAVKNVVMGPKTLEIITRLSKGGLLPGRQIFLLSEKIKESPDPRVILVRTPEEVISLTISQEQSLAVCGGKGIYETFALHKNEIVLTIVHDSFPLADCSVSPEIIEGFIEDKKREKLLRPLSNENCKVTVHYFVKQ